MVRTASTDVWRKPLAKGELGIALLNRGEQETAVTAHWKELGVKPGTPLAIRDVWAHQDLGTFQDSFTAKVGPHATLLLRVAPVK